MFCWNELTDHAKFLLAYLGKKAVCHYRPPMVLVEPTNNCNINCTMCPNDRMSREKGYMPFGLYKELISNNVGFIRNLNLFLMGEPLLHSRISEMVHYARECKIWTSIFTNGTLMDEKLSKDLISAGINVITISFEGLKKDYGKIRVGADYEKVVENIEKLISVRKSLKLRHPGIVIMFMNLDFEAIEVKKFIRKMKRIGVDKVWEIPIHGWPGLEKKNEGVSDNKYPRQKYYPCVLPWSTISVLWDGRVVGCCDDFDGRFVIGNIRDTPDLAKLWNSPKMITLRTKLVNKRYLDLGLCKRCSRIGKNPFKYPILQNAIWSLKEHLL